jgi:hypothetical protein
MKTLLIIVSVLVMTINSNGQWIQLQNSMTTRDVKALAFSGSVLVAGPGSGFYGVYRSTNVGTNWTLISPPNNPVLSFLVDASFIFAGVTSTGIYISSNYGASWSQVLNSYSVRSLTRSPNNFYAGCGASGVFKSTNYGINWSATSNNQTVLSLYAWGTNVLAGTQQNGIYLSTDNGTTWTQTIQYLSVNTFIAGNDQQIYAGTNVGVWKSTNYGYNWIQTSLGNQIVNAFGVNGNSIIAGCNSNGVYVTHDGGITWIQRSEGIENRTVLSLCIFLNFMFAGTSQAGIWVRPVGQVTGIKPVSNEIPKQYNLNQNYPNPFNPSTKISFNLPKTSFVKMVVYDITGKEVETLVNEQLNAGSFEVDFNASKLSSGVYFYRITAEGFTAVKKMILTK